MKNDLYNVIEICLAEIESGGKVEEVLARHPEFSDELRPILNAAVSARGMAVPAPSSQAVARGRTRVLNRAAALREKPSARTPFLFLRQRLSYSLMVLALMLSSGLGLVRVSAGSLPGDNLYPVKRTWEDVRLSLIFDAVSRELLENEFKQTRLDEANELLIEGRVAEINLMGVVSVQNGAYFISGLPVAVTPETTGQIQDGQTVLVSGRTDAQGVIILSSIQTLPNGSFVPLNVSDRTSGRMEFKIVGTLEAMGDQVIIVDQRVVYLQPTTEIEGQLVVGARVEVEGDFMPDGRFVAVHIEIENDGDLEDHKAEPGHDDVPPAEDFILSGEDGANGNESETLCKGDGENSNSIPECEDGHSDNEDNDSENSSDDAVNDSNENDGTSNGDDAGGNPVDSSGSDDGTTEDDPDDGAADDNSNDGNLNDDNSNDDNSNDDNSNDDNSNDDNSNDDNSNDDNSNN